MKNSTFSRPVKERAAVFPGNYAMSMFCLLLLAAALAFRPAAHAQDYSSPPAAPAFTLQELDQMLAPIALYPDALLAQILMASTYPLEVVEAARWSRVNSDLAGDQAVMAAARENWDPSVKSLVAFPQILAVMDERLNWTEDLGNAFLAQEPQVMDRIQNLRQQAYAAGNLRSAEQVRVAPQGQIIAVEPAHPQVLYVPYYDPMVVYGTWWWAASPPVYWAPWPGYYWRPRSAGIVWGAGIRVVAGFFFGAFDWRHRHVNVINANAYYYHPVVSANRQLTVTAAAAARNATTAQVVWQHNPAHRDGVLYRGTLPQQKFARTGAAADPRQDARAPSASAPSVNAGNGTVMREADRPAETKPAVQLKARVIEIKRSDVRDSNPRANTGDRSAHTGQNSVPAKPAGNASSPRPAHWHSAAAVR